MIVANLVDNTTKHSPAGATIRCSTVRPGATAEIRVEDHGTGIAA